MIRADLGRSSPSLSYSRSAQDIRPPLSSTPPFVLPSPLSQSTMAPFLGGIFRSGRTTPTSAGGSTPDSLTPKSGTQRDRAPPSAYKRSQASPALTTTPTTPRSNAAQISRTSPAPVKVKDFAWIGVGPFDPPGPPPERPLPQLPISARSSRKATYDRRVERPRCHPGLPPR